MSLKLAKAAKLAVFSRNYTLGPRLPTKLLRPKLGSEPKYVSADEALASVNSNTDIYVHNHAAAPNVLLEALCRRVDSAGLTDIRTSHLITTGSCPQFDPKYNGKIRNNSLFICGGNRKNVNAGAGDYTPIFLWETPELYTSGSLNVDVALITVSPPDERGFCTLGVDVDCSLAAATSAKRIIALVNSTMPRTRGHSTVHSSHFDFMVKTDRQIGSTSGGEQMSEVEQRIGKIIAENLVENGATLQLGIGAIPDSTLAAMKNHKDLGVHTEMFSDGVVELMNKGIINNQKKAFLPGKTVSSFAYGSPEFYKKIDNNPEFCEFFFNLR
uniref:Acetyl-CoA hydrolase/transferase N-terminal domain-containing protein n=2 Tax=Caenorhabditis japonica TaxID=281687 RepID=A0A8R1EU30_CAEJA